MKTLPNPSVVLVLLLIFSLARAVPTSGAEPDVLTPHRVASLRMVTSAVVAPDGSRVAYTLGVPRQPTVDDDGEPWSELWVTDTHGAAPRPFVTGKVNVSAVRWTPDSQQVAFLAKRGDDKFKALYLIPVDGGEARKAAELNSDLTGFSLAADGKRVAVVASEPEAESKKKLQDKGFKQEIYEEDWRTAKVWIMTLFEKSTSLTSLVVTGHVVQALWSPADDRLLVAVTPTPSINDSMMRQQVLVVDAASGTVSARIERTGKLSDLGWSPDGRRVAMIGAADLHES